MTKNLSQQDNLCKQCSGFDCQASPAEYYKNCIKRRLLHVLKELGNYDISLLGKLVIPYLAEKVIADVNDGKYLIEDDFKESLLKILEAFKND